jgi:hypothetical protein
MRLQLALVGRTMDWESAALLAWFVALAGVCGLGREVGAAPDEAVAETLIAGLRNHCEALQSGIVEFEVLDKGGAVLAKRFVAFDARSQRVRCDVENLVMGGRTAKVLHTTTEFLQYFRDQQGASMVRLNPGDESMVLDGMPIDMRAVGLCRYTHLARGGKVETLLDSIDRMELLGVSLEDDIGVMVLGPNVDGGMTHIVYWIDTAHGYVPIQYEVQVWSPLHGWSVSERYETSWGRVNDTMVPLRGAWSLDSVDGDLECMEEMRFTWKTVNEGVPDELFTRESLELPDGTRVIDTRLGEPIVEEVIGRDRRLPEVPAPRRISWMTRILIIGSVLALLALALVMGLRRLKRRTAPS